MRCGTLARGSCRRAVLGKPGIRVRLFGEGEAVVIVTVFLGSGAKGAIDRREHVRVLVVWREQVAGATGHAGQANGDFTRGGGGHESAPPRAR
jgi:hypothetical protein